MIECRSVSVIFVMTYAERASFFLSRQEGTQAYIKSEIALLSIHASIPPTAIIHPHSWSVSFICKLFTTTMDTALPPGITPPPTVTHLDARDWLFTLSSSVSASTSTFIPYDTTPVSDTQRLIIKFYVFGGMAFFYGTVACCLAWYIYMIGIRGKFRDLPDDLQYDVRRRWSIKVAFKPLTVLIWILELLQYDFVLATQNLPRRPGFMALAYDDNPEWQRVEAAKKEMAERREARQKRREQKAAARASLIEELMVKRLEQSDCQRVSWATSIATLRTDKLTSAEEMSGFLRARRKLERRNSAYPDTFSPPPSEVLPKSILLNTPSARVSAYSNQPPRSSPLRFSTAVLNAPSPIPKAASVFPRADEDAAITSNVVDLEKGLPGTAPGPHEATRLMDPICTCKGALDELDAMIQKTMCEVHGHAFHR